MTQELKAREKTPLGSEAERTKTGPVFVPAVDIYESEESMTLLADMPGVDKSDLSLDLKEDTLSIRGRVTRSNPEGRRSLYREYEEGDYFREFTLSEQIDQNKITATLKDGVLNLFLPKVEKAKPRRIEIKET
ncbi:MAG: Hsp20/alpha crystallin family protein [Thermodesulfobacteriota bacterium]